MTTVRKIKILNQQIGKLNATEAILNIFHSINWKTETLEYLRVFFGENSEIYKRCKQYNEEVEEEYKTKIYSKGSLVLITEYTELLFTARGILQNEIYKKSKVLQYIHGLSLTGILSILTFIIGITYTVGRYEGIKTGQSINNSVVPILNTPDNVSQQKPANSTANKPQTNNIHNDSIR